MKNLLDLINYIQCVNNSNKIIIDESVINDLLIYSLNNNLLRIYSTTLKIGNILKIRVKKGDLLLEYYQDDVFIKCYRHFCELRKPIGVGKKYVKCTINEIEFYHGDINDSMRLGWLTIGNLDEDIFRDLFVELQPVYCYEVHDNYHGKYPNTFKSHSLTLLNYTYLNELLKFKYETPIKSLGGDIFLNFVVVIHYIATLEKN